MGKDVKRTMISFEYSKFFTFDTSKKSSAPIIEKDSNITKIVLGVCPVGGGTKTKRMTKAIASGLSTRDDYSTSVHDLATSLEKLDTEMEMRCLLAEEASRLTTQARETKDAEKYVCGNIKGSTD